MQEQGLIDATLSFEMTTDLINKMGDFLPFGVIGYGKLPLMISPNCPIKASVGCESCTHVLIDRTGAEFSVMQ